MTALLDPEVIAGLRDLGSDDPKFFREMMELYTNQTRAKIRELQPLISAAAAAEVAKISHQLKSSSGNIGAMSMHESFVRLEEKAKAGDAAGMKSEFAALEVLFQKVEVEIQREIAKDAK